SKADPISDLSITINIATDIYTLKKPFLIQYCENKNLKSTGTTTELRARLSRYLRGAITLEDVDDSLDVEKHAELSDSSPDQKDSNKNPSATYSTSLELNDNLNNSLNSFSNRVRKILDNSNTSGSNSQHQSTQLYQNTLIHFEDSITSPENSKHIYQEIAQPKKFFLNEFQPIGHDTKLQIKLEKRRQGENESTTSILAEIESLKDNILQSISMQDNNSLKNLKKFELMQFMLNNKKDDMSEYTEILNEQVLQLNLKTKDIEIENNELRRQIKDKKDRGLYYKHVINFEERKFLNVGIVASTEYDRGVGGYDGQGFGIVIRLLTPKRHVDIRYVLLNRIFLMMGDILSIMPEPSPSLLPLLSRCHQISDLSVKTGLGGKLPSTINENADDGYWGK
ncbi:serine/threonine-protein kinase fray2-like, partial [Aphis craccivora]